MPPLPHGTDDLTGEPATPAWRSRDYLPHWDGSPVPQFITYHLADSLPSSVVERLTRELAEVPDEERALRKRERLHHYLDASHGSCVLGDPECAIVVQNAVLHGDGERYHLLAWTVMPNHVHALIAPLPGWTLTRIVHSWKSFTAHAILKTAAGRAMFPAGGRVWSREYWDRYMRDESHLRDTSRYIAYNPVHAGLCSAPVDWRWSHVRRGA